MGRHEVKRDHIYWFGVLSIMSYVLGGDWAVVARLCGRGYRVVTMSR